MLSRLSTKITSYRAFFVSRTYSQWPQYTPEQLLVADTCRDFCKHTLTHTAAHTDAAHQYPNEIIKQLGQLGFMGVFVNNHYNYHNEKLTDHNDNNDNVALDTVCYTIIMEEISRGCASTGVIVSAHNSLYCAPINYFGTKAQKVIYIFILIFYCYYYYSNYNSLIIIIK